MSYSEDKQFENREHIMAEIKKCSKAAIVFQYIGFAFAVIGVIGDILNTELILESTSWLLLAVIVGIASLSPTLHFLLAKHLLGMEVIKKHQEQ